VLLSKSQISTSKIQIDKDIVNSNSNNKNIHGVESGYGIIVLKMRNDSRLLSAVGTSLHNVCNNLYQNILHTRELSIRNTSSFFRSSTYQTTGYNNNTGSSHNDSHNYNNDLHGNINSSNDVERYDTPQPVSPSFFEFIDPQSTRNIIIPIHENGMSGDDNTLINDDIYWAIYDPFGSSSFLSPQTTGIGQSNIRNLINSTTSHLEIPLDPTPLDFSTETHPSTETPFQAPHFPFGGSIRWGIVGGVNPHCHSIHSRIPIPPLLVTRPSPFSISPTTPLLTPPHITLGEGLSVIDVTTPEVIVNNGLEHPTREMDKTNMMGPKARHDTTTSHLKATVEISHGGIPITDSKIPDDNGIRVGSEKYNYKLRKLENYDLRFLIDFRDLVDGVDMKGELDEPYEVSIMITRVDIDIDNDIKNNGKINDIKKGKGVVIDGRTKFISKYNPKNDSPGLPLEMNSDLGMELHILKVCFVLSGIYHINVFSKLLKFKDDLNCDRIQGDVDSCCAGRFVVE
jgi:hypothetical protein